MHLLLRNSYSKYFAFAISFFSTLGEVLIDIANADIFSSLCFHHHILDNCFTFFIVFCFTSRLIEHAINNFSCCRRNVIIFNFLFIWFNKTKLIPIDVFENLVVLWREIKHHIPKILHISTHNHSKEIIWTSNCSRATFHLCIIWQDVIKVLAIVFGTGIFLQSEWF